jgi:ribosomal protein S18 acetylase RimI-like enzyme
LRNLSQSKENNVVKIRFAVSDEDWKQVKSLFIEYFEWIKHDQGIDLSFQGIEGELKELPGAFSPPAGCMLLAEADDVVVACVALRPLDASICEMKRIYVKPEYRAKGLGRALGEQIIQEAKSMGYQLMRLDTANTMIAAQKLYSKLGFKPIEQYYDLPSDILERAIFMELFLQ